MTEAVNTPLLASSGLIRYAMVLAPNPSTIGYQTTTWTHMNHMMKKPGRSP